MHRKSSTIPNGTGDQSSRARQSDERADEPSTAHSGPLAGLPKWITLELIHQTIRVWQPYYKAALTMKDAVAMLQNVQRLGRVLAS